MRVTAGFWPSEEPDAAPGDGEWYIVWLPEDELSSGVRRPTEAEVRAAVAAINGRGALMAELTQAEADLADTERRREAAVKYIARYGGLLIEAGFPGGDQDVIHDNIEALIRERDRLLVPSVCSEGCCQRLAMSAVASDLIDLRPGCHEACWEIDGRARFTDAAIASHNRHHPVRHAAG